MLIVQSIPFQLSLASKAKPKDIQTKQHCRTKTRLAPTTIPSSDFKDVS